MGIDPQGGENGATDAPARAGAREMRMLGSCMQDDRAGTGRNGKHENTNRMKTRARRLIAASLVGLLVRRHARASPPRLRTNRLRARASKSSLRAWGNRLSERQGKHGGDWGRGAPPTLRTECKRPAQLREHVGKVARLAETRVLSPIRWSVVYQRLSLPVIGRRDLPAGGPRVGWVQMVDQVRCGHGSRPAPRTDVRVTRNHAV